MQCPKCAYAETKVLDTRNAHNDQAIRRRRQCLQCGYRFSTIETMLREGVLVIKRDGRHEEFSQKKLLFGIERATQKCAITLEEVDQVLNTVLQYIERQESNEISSRQIGEWTMDALKQINPIAYVRFASIYKEFRNIEDLKREIQALEAPFTESPPEKADLSPL